MGSCATVTNKNNITRTLNITDFFRAKHLTQHGVILDSRVNALNADRQSKRGLIHSIFPNTNYYTLLSCLGQQQAVGQVYVSMEMRNAQLIYLAPRFQR